MRGLRYIGIAVAVILLVMVCRTNTWFSYLQSDVGLEADVPVFTDLPDTASVDEMYASLTTRLRQQRERKGDGAKAPSSEVVLIAIDTSQSMRRTNLLSSFVSLSKSLTSEDMTGLVTFDARAVNLLPFGQYSAEQINEVCKTLTFTGARTELSSAVTLSLELLKRIERQHKKLVIITDIPLEYGPEGLRDGPQRWASPQDLSGISLDVMNPEFDSLRHLSK